MKNRVTVPLLISGSLLGSMLLAGCGDTTTREVAAAPLASSSPAQSSPAAVDDGFVASGPLIVEHQVDVAAQRDGVVSAISAEPGTRVRQGQVLQGCARDTSGRVETGDEAHRAANTGRPSVHGAQRVDYRPRETPATAGVGL